MNIVELIRSITTEYLKSSNLTDEIHIDYTVDDGNTENVGIFTVGDTKIGEDILGNETRRNSIVMYLVRQASEDCERLENASFLINMADAFDNIREDFYDVDIGEGENIKHGKLKSIACSNSMLYGRTTGTGDPVYQIQLLATYKLYD